MGTSGSRNHQRRQWIVNPSLQYRFIGIMLLVLFLLTAGALASVYTALWVTLRTFELMHDTLAVSLLATVGIMTTLELLLIAPVIVWVGIRMTHKVAGPLVRINAALLRMAKGQYDVDLRLRKGDSLVEVAEAVNTLAASLRSRGA